MRFVIIMSLNVASRFLLEAQSLDLQKKSWPEFHLESEGTDS